MNAFEATVYEITKLFFIPVLLLIVLSLLYACTALGAFVMELIQRRTRHYRSPLLFYFEQENCPLDDLELWILKRLEWLRIISRTTPLLGLIATMIPMGPALLALTRSDAQGVANHLVVAFSSVILALLSASITFFVMTIRRRWLLEELREIEKRGDQ